MDAEIMRVTSSTLLSLSSFTFTEPLLIAHWFSHRDVGPSDSSSPASEA